MKANLKLTLATFLILALTHSSQAWTGDDVRNAGAIIVLGQRLICQDQPAGVWGNTPKHGWKTTKRTCSKMVRGSEMPLGQIRNRRWRGPGDFTCESEVSRDPRGAPLVALICTKFFNIELSH